MKLKTVEVEGKTYAEVKDGHPVYIDGDKEVPFKAAEAKAKIKSQADELAESQSAAGKLAKWEKLGKLDEVRKSVKTLAALGDDFDPEKATVKLAEAQAEAESLRETVADRDGTISDLQKSNFDLSFGGQVKGSPWIKDNMLEAFDNDRQTVVDLYGRYVKPAENGGGPVYLDSDGKPLKIDGNSPTLEQFLDHHVPKTLRRDSGATGSGDKGGLSTGSGGSAPKHKGDFKNTDAKVKWMGENPDKFEGLPIDPSTQPADKPPAATPAGV